MLAAACSDGGRYDRSTVEIRMTAEELLTKSRG